MKSLRAPMAIALLSLSITACGDSGGTAQRRTASTASTAESLPAAQPSSTPLSHEDKNDDVTIYAYGHAAGTAESRAVTAVVDLYYRAAAAADGVTACSLLAPSIAKSFPEDYGRVAGPTYLRGGTTCHAMLSLMFKHFRHQLAGAVEVTGVRIQGHYAFAFLRSATLPYRYTRVERQDGAWKIASPLGAPLP